MTDARLMPIAGEPPSWPSSDPHPAPARHQAPLSVLWFGFLGAPAAWSVQMVVNLAVAAHACYPRLTPLQSPAVAGLRGIAFGVSLAALIVCLASTAVAWRTWWRTRDEHQARSGRAQEHNPGTALAETGEGRTRFMALSGVLASIMFLIGTIVSLATILLVSPCGFLLG